MRKKLCNILLSLAMVAMMMPLVTLSASAATGTPVSTFSDLKSKLEAGTSVYLTSDIDIQSTITIPSGKNVTLDMNGNDLSRETDSRAFWIYGSLTVINSSNSSSCFYGDMYQDYSRSTLFYIDGGTLNLSKENATGSVYLKENEYDFGAGVYVMGGGTFNMYDKAFIEGCWAEGGGDANWGGGVLVYGHNTASKSVFNMYGGTIDGCRSEYGGGVFVEGNASFKMSGGTIQNCYCNQNGGNHGGGVYVYNGADFDMSGGTIQNNWAADSYGGVCVDGSGSTFTMTGGTISGNYTKAGNTKGIAAKEGGKIVINGGYIADQGSTGKYNTYCFEGSTFTITSGRFAINDGEYVPSLDSRTCTVTLDGNGGSDATVSATWGNAMTTVTPPTWAGHKFLGYYTEEEGGTKYYNANGTSAHICDYVGPLTLYGQWELAPCTVTLNKNGGTGGTDSVIVYNGSAMPTDGVTMPTRTGYTFAGYFDAETGGNQYYKADGTSYQNWNKTSTTATLYAHWTANKYTVTLDAQGGTGGTASVEATYDAAMPAGLTVPSKPGYSFNGFYDAASGGKQYYTSAAASANIWDKTSDTTLYAHWTSNNYTIQYWSKDDREAAKKDSAFVEGVASRYTAITYGSFELPSAETLGLTREHYDFLGWNIYQDQNWAMYQADKQYSGGLSTAKGGTAVLYAAWQEKPTFVVAYNANGGSGEPASVEVYRDDSYTVSNTVPTREGYTFTGWKYGTKADYKGGDEITDVQASITLVAQWERNNCVSYHPNGGSFVVTPSNLYPGEGETVNIDFVNLPEREGYNFLGYATSAGAESPAYTADGTKSFNMGTKTVTLYAVWKAESYDITFSGSEGRYSFEGSKPALVERDQDYSFTLRVGDTYNTENLSVTVNGVLLDNPSAVTDGGDKLYTYSVKKADKAQNVVIRGIALTPQKINYELNGGSIAGDYPKYYESGTATTLPTDVQKKGYTFGGWFENEGCTGDAVTEIGTDASGEKTFYAKWTANQYTIVYDPNGGSDAPEATVAVYDSAAELAAKGSMTYDSYTFLGWDTDANAEKPAYKAGESVKNLTAEKDASVTMYAIWNEEHFQVTYHLNGGVNVTDFATMLSVKNGGTITTPAAAAVSKTGCDFKGWATQEGSAKVVYDAEAAVTVTGDLDLYAVWEAGNYTIKYINGEEVVGTDDMTYGTAAALRTEEGLTAPAGKEFLGWSTNSDASVAEFIGGQSVTAIGDGTASEVVLYAVWGDKTPKFLSYDANGGAWKGSAPANVADSGDGTVTVGTFDDSTLYRPGYTRDGWIVGEKKVADGANIVISEDTTAYANWTANTYKIDFESNGGYGIMTDQRFTFDKEEALNACEYEREGYEFRGWATTADGEVAYFDEQPIINLTSVNEETITLYAVWSTDLQPITFKEGIVNLYKVDGTSYSNVLTDPNKDDEVTYSSDNTEVATVDSATGEVTIKGYGSTVITAVAEKDCADPVTASYTLVVEKKPVYVTAKDKTAVYGEKVTVAATDVEYTDKLGNTVSLTPSGTLAISNLDGHGVGQYSIKPSGITADGYDLIFTAGTLTVTPKVLTGDDFEVSCEDKTYDGNDAAKLTAAVLTDSLVNSSDDVAGVIGGTFESVDAGTDKTVNYEISELRGRDAANYTIAGAISGEKAANINQMGVTFIFGTASFVYDGQPHDLAMSAVDENRAVFNDYTVTYKDTDEETVTPTNVGTYTTVITLKDTVNYKMSQTEAEIPNVEIIKPTDKDFYIISDSGKNLFVGDTVKMKAFYGGNSPKVDWSTDDEDVATVDADGVVTTKSSGAVTITATVNDGNYETKTADFTLIVNKKPVNLSVSGQVLTYDGTVRHITLESDNPNFTPIEGENVDVSYVLKTDSSSNVAKNVGEYYVNYKVNDVKYAGSGSAAMVINKVNVEIAADNASKKFGEGAPAYTVQGHLLGDDQELPEVYDRINNMFTMSSEGDVTSAVAGTYDIAIELADGHTLDEDPNYNFTIGETPGTLTVEPSEAALTIENVEDVVYTAEPAVLNADVLLGEMTLDESHYVLKYFSDETCADEVSAVEVGTYYVKAIGNSDSCKGESDPVAFSILKADPIVKTSGNLYYNGKNKTGKVQFLALDGNVLGEFTAVKKKPGTYSASFEGNETYNAATGSWKIVIKPTKIKKLSKGKKSFKVKVVKLSKTYVTGYSVRYSLNKNMSKAKTKTISKKYKKVTKKVKKLKKKKTYYVQVRSYKKISGKNYYSSWSAVKKVKTK